MDPMDLETKPQVDRLRSWRERSAAAGKAFNSDTPARFFLLQLGKNSSRKSTIILAWRCS